MLGRRQLLNGIGAVVANAISPVPGFAQVLADADAAAVDASRSEAGILIYSNLSAENWGPVLAEFRSAYPWIKVETLDLVSGEVFSRYEAETGAGKPSADFLISVSPDAWVRLAAADAFDGYQSPLLGDLPAFAYFGKGLYTFSTDPLVLLSNKAILAKQDRPTGLVSLGHLASKMPRTFAGRIASYDQNSSFGIAAWRAILFHAGERGWKALEELSPLLRLETGGSGALTEKTSTGEYLVSFPVSGVSLFPRLKKPGGELLDFIFPDDGTPIVLRGMAISANAKSRHSSQLLLDYLLSTSGQRAIAKGGLTPYRPDLGAIKAGANTYQSIKATVGESNLVHVGPDAAMLASTAEFKRRFDDILLRK